MNEIVVGNFSFVVLFSLMLWSWVHPFFPGLRAFTRVSTWGMFLANLSLALLLMLRWLNSGHFPLSNLYESLIFLSWAFTSIHLLCTTVTSLPFLASITAPTTLLTYTFAAFSLPKEMQQASALVPALQSNWLMMHVSIMILSYAALLFGSLFSLIFLLLPRTVKFQTGVPAETPSLTSEGPLFKLSPLGETIDNYSYRILGLGFPLLTMGILSGAVWANEAWGSYWSWDPKETWALITWLVFAIYLHTRLTRGWTGTKPAAIAACGFVTVWICYLGVNILGSGLHSYGWFTA
jgi:cytochrome c-type biogenesis protein CcsB|uniref:Cytochrome c biogenesis protein CcsA n=1 Tax=Choricystis parasitica TaxID=41300 RepID=A0A097KNP0_9CHLO|nr:heme attachment to plastid cytochrome c [Choricystis parasitica]AIT94824.1 heme attachment to plastid cytochrome c [Choricystis parasitica]